MKLRPLPVLYPCAGCPQWGDGAREAARLLERRGAAEMSGLNPIGLAKARSRYPVVTIDACGAACAQGWLERQGVPVHFSYLLTERERDDAALAAERIAADWR